MNEQNAETLFQDFKEKVGPLNAGNDLANRFTLKDIVDMWGMLFNINLITNENALPTIIFHGMQDKTCPYDASTVYIYERFPASYGGLPVYEKLVSLSVPVQATMDPLGWARSVYRKFQSE